MKNKMYVYFKKIFSNKVQKMFVLIYFILLLIYDFIVFDRDMDLLLKKIFLVVVIDLFVYFGVYFVLWIQVKNPIVSVNIFEIFSRIVLILFGGFSCVLCINYLVYGFTVGTFLCPTVCMAILKARRREKNK